MLDTNNLISSSQSIFSKSNIFWFINFPLLRYGLSYIYGFILLILNPIIYFYINCVKHGLFIIFDFQMEMVFLSLNIVI